MAEQDKKPLDTETEEERRRERIESEQRAAEAQQANRRAWKDEDSSTDLRIGGLRGSPD